MWKHFYSLDSAGKHGTRYQLRNLLNHSNVVDKPIKDFDACEDFLFLIIHSQVIMTTLTALKMQSLNDAPAHDTHPTHYAFGCYVLKKERKFWMKYVVN